MNIKILDKMGFRKELESLKNSKCPFCGQMIKDKNDFKDDKSFKEFKISGLCQKCQGNFFK